MESVIEPKIVTVYSTINTVTESKRPVSGKEKDLNGNAGDDNVDSSMEEPGQEMNAAEEQLIRNNVQQGDDVLNGRHPVVVLEDIGKYLDRSTYLTVKETERFNQNVPQNFIRQPENSQSAEIKASKQSNGSSLNSKNFPSGPKLVLNNAVKGNAESQNRGTLNVTEENANWAEESIMWRCFKKKEVNKDIDPFKKGKDHQVVECMMCRFSTTGKGKTLENLMLDHLLVNHNVQKSLISSETAKSIKEWKDVLIKKNSTRNPSTAWDYFVKRQCWLDIACILCDFTNEQRKDGSTATLLQHFYGYHHFDRKLLPYKSMCH